MRCRKKNIITGMLFACIWLLFAIPVEVTARNDIQQNTDRVQAYTIDGKMGEISCFRRKTTDTGKRQDKDSGNRFSQ